MPTTTTKRKRLVGPMSRRLLDARTDSGLSRKALSEMIGASERLVNYYEDPGYGRNRKSYIIRAWADATGRDFEELWGPSERPISRSGWFSPSALAEAV